MTSTAAAALGAVRDRFRAALQDSLDGGGEAALLRAYDLGRQSMAEGLGILDLAAIQQEALAEALAAEAAPEERARVVVALGSLFAECLSPFEMAQRGIQETLETVTDLRRRYESERELGLLKSRLVSLTSHDVANALSVIQCALVFLREAEGKESWDGRDHAYQLLKRNVRSLCSTAGALFSMGRLQGGRLKLYLRRTDLRALLRDNLACLEGPIRRKKLRVCAWLGREPRLVRADKEAAAFALSILLTGVVESSPERSRIEVRLSPEGPTGDRVLVSILGSGARRGARPAGPSEEAFAAGRTFAKTILRAHGSPLRVQRLPGPGRRFSFFLPAWKEPPETRRAPSERGL